MFIIANTLGFSGGTTFLIRFCGEQAQRGVRIGVLVLVEKIEDALKTELEQVADVYHLRDFTRAPFRWLDSSPALSFLPLDLHSVSAVAKIYGQHIHVMGVFGLLFAVRLINYTKTSWKVTAGVYHQYEYVFERKSFFARRAQQIFTKLGPNNVIFFNEANRDFYSRYFKIDYANAAMVPVGIKLPEPTRSIGSFHSRRIVSIGNLNHFKTYNTHMVNLMPLILRHFGVFTYEIYGEGETECELKEVIKRSQLDSTVLLRGRIPYADFSKVLEGAFLFVGSGTAILEASALGVPSIVGVESTKDPVTYGFLSDVEGFSYNEINKYQPLRPLIDFIEVVASSEATWRVTAERCQKKAELFSVKRTISGFEKAGEKAAPCSGDQASAYTEAATAFSFAVVAAKHFLKLDDSFGGRRHRSASIKDDYK